MLIRMSTMFVLSFDLHTSLAVMADGRKRFQVRCLFATSCILYACEFVFTLHVIRMAMCRYVLWCIGFTHYAIKTLVSYSYMVRARIVIRGESGNHRVATVATVSMMVIILFSAIGNLLKVFLMYTAAIDETKTRCVFDLGKFADLDEIMFGSIDGERDHSLDTTTSTVDPPPIAYLTMRAFDC